MPVNNKVVFCNAFPISKQSYNDAIGAQNKDFVNHFRDYYKEKSEREQWELYNKEIIEPYILLKSGFEGYGFTFADECTFKDYTDFVKDTSYHTLIIFSHCIDNSTRTERIEFFDAMRLSTEIVGSLLNVERIYDFSVCKSIFLAQLMKTEVYNAVCGSTNKLIPVTTWLYIYGELFAEMVTKGKSYLESMFNLKTRYIRMEHGK